MKEYEKDYKLQKCTMTLDNFGSEKKTYTDAGTIRLALSYIDKSKVLNPNYMETDFITKYNGSIIISENDRFIFDDSTFIVTKVIPARRFTYICAKEV